MSVLLQGSPRSSKYLFLLCMLLSSCSGTNSGGDLPGVTLLGGPGRGVGKLFQPRAITACKTGGCVIIDRSGRAQVFDNSGLVTRVWALPEWSSGHPIDLCETPEGTYLVADTHYMRILEFNREGLEIRRFGEGTGLELVRGIDLAPDGTIFVASYGEKDRIFRFTRSGELLGYWGERGDGADQFLRPEGLAVAPDGSILIVDCGHRRVLRFTASGKLLQQIGGPGQGKGEFMVPFDVDVLEDGTILVIDRSGCRLQIFSAEGECLAEFGGLGRGKGRLHEPRGIAAAIRGGKIEVFIADTGNNRISNILLSGEDLR